MATQKTLRLTQFSLLTALIVVLQLISYSVKIGTFSLTLTLVPLILGAALLGQNAGAALGAVFGAVTFICAGAGLDMGGNMLWNVSPWWLCAVCLVKGAAAGYVAGLLYRLVSPRHPFAAVVVAAVAAPIVNTGLFALAMLFIFRETLVLWAAGTDILYYIIFGMLGINFVIEFSLNVLLSSVVSALLSVIKNPRFH